jgi:hypothetical protein
VETVNDRRQRRHHFVAAGKAPLELGRQHLEHGRVDLRIEPVDHRRRRWHARLPDQPQCLEIGLAFEKPLQRQGFPEQHPEREDVGASIDRQPLGLLGRHVAQLAAQRAGARLVVADARRRLGDAEVEQLHPTGPREHDVGGADVAVHDVEWSTVVICK